MASAGRYSWSRSDGSTGKAWRARWTGPDGKPRERRGFPRKSDAIAYADDREAEARHGVVLEQAASPTLQQWAATWLEGVRVRPSTEASYRYAVARIVRDLGHRPVAQLRKSELQQWRRSLEPRYSPGTAAQTSSVLSMLLRAAVEDGLLDRSPAPSERGRSSRTVDPDELLTPEQVRDWCDAMPKHCREMPLLAAMTGLRQGELLGLRLANVDMLRREVRVVEQLQTLAAGPPVWVPPKTAAGVRTVPLFEEALQALARHLAAYPAGPSDPVFRTARGLPWRRGSFGTVWRKARDEAELPAWATFHSLRDVFASYLLSQRVDSQSLVTVMGHSSLAEMKPYGRLTSESRDNVRAALAAAWSVADGQGVGRRPSATL